MEHRKDEAKALIKDGQQCILDGKIDDALLLFKKSAELFPTAEAFTLWAWMLSYEGKLDECIQLCKRAIELDPDFGNAYNDIGSYLIDLERLEDAIEWLEKAKSAKHYESRHFPYLNLARVYLKLGRDSDALSEYQTLLGMDPNNVEAMFLIEYLSEGNDEDRFFRLFSQN